MSLHPENEKKKYKIRTVRGRALSIKSLKTFSLIASGIFGLMSLLVLVEPSMAFGRSVGLFVTLGVLLLLGLSTAVSAYAWSFAFRDRRVSLSAGVAYAVLVLCSGVVLNSFLINQIDRRSNLTQALLINKIEYFCEANFNQSQCVKQVNTCASCVLEIDKYRRDKIVEKLAAFRTQYPAEFVRQPAATQMR